MIIPQKITNFGYFVVMSPSRNFPAQAEPSLGTSISELKFFWAVIRSYSQFLMVDPVVERKKNGKKSQCGNVLDIGRKN